MSDLAEFAEIFIHPIKTTTLVCIFMFFCCYLFQSELRTSEQLQELQKSDVRVILIVCLLGHYLTTWWKQWCNYCRYLSRFYFSAALFFPNLVLTQQSHYSSPWWLFFYRRFYKECLWEGSRTLCIFSLIHQRISASQRFDSMSHLPFCCCKYTEHLLIQK